MAARLNPVWIALCLIAPALASQAGPAQIPSDRPVAFVDVNVVSMRTEEVLERRTVLIERGRIAAIFPSTEGDPPAEAFRIQAGGLYLMPGLADMHTHFLHGNPHWRNDLFLYAASGVTTVREMWGSTEFLPWRAAAASGALFAPAVYLSSPGMDGPETRYGTPPVTSPEQARALVAWYRLVGFDFIKVYNDLRPDIYQAILEEAARQGIRVAGHPPTRVPFATVVTSGQASIEHLAGLWREVVSGSYYTGTLDETKFAPLASLVRDSGAWIAPTLFVFARNRDDDIVLLRRPEMRYVSNEMKRWFAGPQTFSTDKDVAALKVNLQLTARRLHQAGVNLLAGSDSGCCYVTPGFSLHDELRLLTEAGLSPYEALRLATVNAAAFLGNLEGAGTVETGKRADLILVEGNPLEDVANAARRAGVMIGGWWRSEENLRAALEEIARSYGN